MNRSLCESFNRSSCRSSCCSLVAEFTSRTRIMNSRVCVVVLRTKVAKTSGGDARDNGARVKVNVHGPGFVASRVIARRVIVWVGRLMNRYQLTNKSTVSVRRNAPRPPFYNSWRFFLRGINETPLETESAVSASASVDRAYRNRSSSRCCAQRAHRAAPSARTERDIETSPLP